MNTSEILERIKHGIANLMIGENNILNRGLNERMLSSRLADYLRPLFEDYNVDPEYNGDIHKPNDRKAISIAQNRLLEMGHTINESNSYRLSPDIIIHIRNTNEHNLAVIEVKKDTSPNKEKEFDLIKLEHLTINYLGNHYNYKLGIALILGTGPNTGNNKLLFFQGGLPKTEQTLE